MIRDSSNSLRRKALFKRYPNNYKLQIFLCDEDKRNRNILVIKPSIDEFLIGQ